MLKPNSRSILLTTVGACLLATVLYSAPSTQRSFDNPQAAIQATIEASDKNDVGALRDIFGPNSKDIVESGDVNQDREDRAELFRGIGAHGGEGVVEPFARRGPK